jgi:hypothetical protein
MLGLRGVVHTVDLRLRWLFRGLRWCDSILNPITTERFDFVVLRITTLLLQTTSHTWRLHCTTA